MNKKTLHITIYTSHKSTKFVKSSLPSVESSLIMAEHCVTVDCTDVYDGCNDEL